MQEARTHDEDRRPSFWPSARLVEASLPNQRVRLLRDGRIVDIGKPRVGAVGSAVSCPVAGQLRVSTRPENYSVGNFCRERWSCLLLRGKLFSFSVCGFRFSFLGFRLRRSDRREKQKQNKNNNPTKKSVKILRIVIKVLSVINSSSILPPRVYSSEDNNSLHSKCLEMFVKLSFLHQSDGDRITE